MARLEWWHVLKSFNRSQSRHIFDDSPPRRISQSSLRFRAHPNHPKTQQPVDMRTFTIVALLVGVALAEREYSPSPRFAPVDVYQRNSPALNQLFGQAVGQSWKFGQLAAKGVQGELDTKSRNVLRQMRQIVSKRALNVRNAYAKLQPATKRNLQTAVPPVQEAINNYPTFKPIVEIVRKQLPHGFLATLTN